MKRLIFFVLLFIGCLQINSQNLVLNPGFEAWSKISKPEGWTTALSCLKDSLIINSGVYSCHQATTTDSKELGQLIPVTGGNHYRISFWYRNDPSGTGNGCRIWSNWKDAEGNSITDDLTLPLLHSGYLKSETWNQYATEVAAPANAHYFNLIIRTLPNSITYWDDIIFEVNVPTYRSEMSSDNIRIYPNPASNYLTISNIYEMQHINIQTLTGVKVWSSDNLEVGSTIVQISSLKNGMYIIRIYSNDRCIIRMFIKN